MFDKVIINEKTMHPIYQPDPRNRVSVVCVFA